MSRCNAREYAEWQAWYELNPWGEDRADLRAGIIASTIANTNRGKGQKAFKPSDFMPEFDKPPPKPQTQAEMASLMNVFAARQNAYVARRGA
jgi:hypothetical protein